MKISAIWIKDSVICAECGCHMSVQESLGHKHKVLVTVECKNSICSQYHKIGIIPYVEYDVIESANA